MLKRTLLLLSLPLLSLLSFSACEKEEDEIYIEPYVVQGLEDIQWQKDFTGKASARMPLSLMYMNSVQDYITLSLENVPAGISYTISPAAGYAPFSTEINFSDSQAAPGNYVLKLRCTGTRTHEKVFDINLRVLPTASILNSMTGIYQNSSPLCFASQNSFTHNVTASPSIPSTLVINNFYGTGANLQLAVNSANGDFTVFERYILEDGINWKVSGSGYVTLGNNINVTAMHLNLILEDSTTANVKSCNLTLFR